MSPTLDSLTAEALKLSTGERAELAERADHQHRASDAIAPGLGG